MILLVVSIRILEPRPGVLKIQVDGIRAGRLKVNAIEKVFFIPLVMHDDKFRRIKKAPGVQAIRGNKVSPLRAAVSEVETHVGSAKCTVGRSHAPVRSRNALTRACGYVNDQARFTA